MNKQQHKAEALAHIAVGYQVAGNTQMAQQYWVAAYRSGYLPPHIQAEARKKREAWEAAAVFVFALCLAGLAIAARAGAFY
jgi:predicted N-formylglutamate amidohydrolase